MACVTFLQQSGLLLSLHKCVLEPVLAQKETERLVSAALTSFSDILHLVYYDDLLLASPDPDALRVATIACVTSAERSAPLPPQMRPRALDRQAFRAPRGLQHA